MRKQKTKGKLKLKSKRGAVKRFKLTATGKVFPSRRNRKE
jgi:ribosomal protein L35